MFHNLRGSSFSGINLGDGVPNKDLNMRIEEERESDLVHNMPHNEDDDILWWDWIMAVSPPEIGPIEQEKLIPEPH